MSYPTNANSMVTDTASQSSLLSIGSATATAQELLNQNTVHALGTLFEAACAQQQATQILADAALGKAVSFHTLKLPNEPTGGAHAKDAAS